MSEYLKLLTGRHLLVIIGGLYLMLLLIDAEKANEVFRDVVGIGENIIQRLPLIRKPSVKNGTPLPDSAKLKNFLANPNQELLKIKNGRYHRPAGYYIEINSDKGTCTAKYSKEFAGRWTTPAKILCPQIKEFWCKTPPPSSPQPSPRK